MTTSQNGWPASKDRSAIGVVNPIVDGVSFPNGIKGGDVNTILSYVADQFHKHVEPLHATWCWGYFYKVIEGSSTVSNHASGTAIDINAPHHPMGVYGTFTSAQRSAIRTILNFCEGAVRWGGDYSGRKDEMHFEINASAATVARIAAKIRGVHTAPPPVKPPVTSSVLQKGSTGQAVKNLQAFFNKEFPAYRDSVSVNRGHLLTVDGIFGDATVAWVKEFQKRTSLTQDGIVGSVTHAKLKSFGYQY